MTELPEKHLILNVTMTLKMVMILILNMALSFQWELYMYVIIITFPANFRRVFHNKMVTATLRATFTRRTDPYKVSPTKLYSNAVSLELKW